MLDSTVLLLRIAATWPLPGLGLLALPEGATPRLVSYPLHTPLAVAAVLPNGRTHRGQATVEEIARTVSVERGLLLDFSPVLIEQLAAGTEIWLLEEAAGPFGLEP
ncbi:hypothetical protein [Hymenobacter glacialis]|uniref:Uncharacterized protein n=1 Tax=Hymenobacter glacialis TaxID=1908236 RepID=A0A1G1T017_9BACT|nr:hypothetical protein [Hymenobacter glacialis]OGX84224.1 hypothetical protein BEN48_16295 [Hymenobacter glacialis]